MSLGLEKFLRDPSGGLLSFWMRLRDLFVAGNLGANPFSLEKLPTYKRSLRRFPKPRHLNHSTPNPKPMTQNPGHAPSVAISGHEIVHWMFRLTFHCWFPLRDGSLCNGHGPHPSIAPLSSPQPDTCLGSRVCAFRAQCLRF